jgi:hypothetical protein
MFDPLLNLARWILILAGLFLLSTSSAVVASVTAVALSLLVIYTRCIRSVWYQSRLIRRDFERLRLSRPSVPERELLYQMTCSRHPRWGPELVEQMLLDYPTLDELTPIIVKMEKGFRGFRPG